MRFNIGLKTCLSLSLATMFAGTGIAQQTVPSKADAEFYKGYYQHHEANNLPAAVKSYKRAIQLGVSPSIADAVENEMTNLQESVVTSSFENVMPADAIAYIELSNPANHVEQLARLMGLTGKPKSDSGPVVVLPIDREIAIPSDFQISPALLREMKKLRGAAVAITEIKDSNDGPPVEGLLVIHPGESDLLQGILETSIQFAPASERLGGFPTFTIENKVWIVQTQTLIFVSDSKETIVDGLDRIKNSKLGSLADVDSFKTARATEKDAAVFAYVNPEQMMTRFGHMMRGEMSMIRVAIDLDHLQHITSSIKATDNGLQTRFSVQYSEDHNSFGYGLIRTTPLSKKALSKIPSEAAVVVGMGLNPQMVLAAQTTAGQHISALDIGRELFANIEEIGLFVLPSTIQGNREFPNVGVVFTANDLDKSNRLWNEMLSLPSKMKIDDGPRAKTIEINGVAAREYTFNDPGAPELVIAKLGDEAMVAGTRMAVEAVIAANRSGTTLANDKSASAFWEASTESTAKALFVKVGPALQLAASMSGGNDASEMMMIKSAVDNLSIIATVDESHTNFDVTTSVVDLPKFENIIKTLAKMNDRMASPSDVAQPYRVRRTDTPVTASDATARKVKSTKKQIRKARASAEPIEPASRPID